MERSSRWRKNPKRRRSSHYQANGVKSCGKNYESAVPSAPNTGVTLWEAEEEPLLLTGAEIDVVVDRVYTKARKALEPDGIPKSVWTIVYRINLRVLNAALKTEYSTLTI